jgi:hypothetical protein
MQSKTQSATVTDSGNRPLTFRQRIGSTDFIVSVHFSERSSETFGDKVLRLIKSEVDK